MRILLLNGNPDPEALAFEDFLDQAVKACTARGVQVLALQLRDLKIHYCTGCWGCWVKTPGECTARDDSAIVCREAMHSDVVLFASPIRMGFTTALLKKAVDKLIPILHPYFALSQGEYHHLPRYPRYPRHALLLEKSEGSDPDDLAIIRACYERLAINMKTHLAALYYTDQKPEEIAHALNRL